MSTHANQRRLEHLTAKNEATTHADERFFARFPDRRHRVRLASAHEVEIHHLMGGRGRPKDGWRLYAVIRSLDGALGGARMRGFLVFPAAAAATVDSLTEQECAETFEWFLRIHKQFHEIEQKQAARAKKAARATGGAA